MKTLQKRKKLILTGLLLLLVTVGTTFAWWTASSTVSQEIKMGSLAIKGQLEKLADDTGFEPGLTTEQDGTLKNTGSIPALIRVENNSQVKFKGQTAYTDITDGAVSMTLKPKETTDGYWYKDQQGRTYVLLDATEVASIEVNSELVGDKMNNDYMNASVKLAGSFKATQVQEGAIAQEFGISSDELEDFEPASARTRSGGASAAMSYLRELLNR